MIDRVDQDRRAETAGELHGILERFLLGSRLNEKESNFYPKDLLKKNSSNENKISFNTEILKTKNFEKNVLKKEIIPLLEINPLRLERGNVNRRLDDFIIEGMNRRIPQGANRPLPLDNLPVPGLDPKKWFSSSSGLWASIFKGVRRDYTAHGEKVVLEDYNNIHFTPEGRGHFDPSKMTKSLASGIQGIVELIDAVDQGRFEAAPVFVGTTNINMALIAQRLGFVIVDECRTSDGKINKNLRSFTVVGKLDDIRARVGEFKRAGVDQKLVQRSQRLKIAPKLEPARA